MNLHSKPTSSTYNSSSRQTCTPVFQPNSIMWSPTIGIEKKRKTWVTPESRRNTCMRPQGILLGKVCFFICVLVLKNSSPSSFFTNSNQWQKRGTKSEETTRLLMKQNQVRVCINGECSISIHGSFYNVQQPRGRVHPLDQ